MPSKSILSLALPVFLSVSRILWDKQLLLPSPFCHDDHVPETWSQQTMHWHLWNLQAWGILPPVFLRSICHSNEKLTDAPSHPSPSLQPGISGNLESDPIRGKISSDKSLLVPSHVQSNKARAKKTSGMLYTQGLRLKFQSHEIKIKYPTQETLYCSIQTSTVLGRGARPWTYSAPSPLCCSIQPWYPKSRMICSLGH